MWKLQPGFSVHLGGNTYINTPNLIVCKGAPVLRVGRNAADGTMNVRLHVYDKSGQRVAFIADDTVVHGDKAGYDIAIGDAAYIVTERGTGRVIARVQRRGAQGADLDVHVHTYMPDGFLLDAGPHRTNVGGAMLTGHVFEDCDAGITIE